MVVLEGADPSFSGYEPDVLADKRKDQMVPFILYALSNGFLNFLHRAFKGPHANLILLGDVTHTLLTVYRVVTKCERTLSLGNRLRVMPLCDRSPSGIRIHTVTILSRLSPAYWTMGPYLFCYGVELTASIFYSKPYTFIQNPKAVSQSFSFIIIPQISHFVNP